MEDELFSPLIHSTLTAAGKLSNVFHNEQDFIYDLELFMEEYDGPIKYIDCNYGHISNNRNEFNNITKKSKRGRKKKTKSKKPRKYQGDGSSFNSQIMFSVEGIRQIENITLTKIYKIKVFRTGNIQIPGVLMEDMSDIKEPLEIICDCFRTIFHNNDIHVISLFSVMRNFKYRLIQKDEKGNIKNKYIDLQELADHISDYLSVRINTNFPVLKQNLIELIYNAFQNHTYLIDYEKLQHNLSWHKEEKNLFISINYLKNLINKTNIFTHLNKLQFISNMDDEIIKNISIYLISSEITSLKTKLIQSEDNIISSVRYNSEKYPGLLLKFKTPIHSKPDKKTTVKIFESGKFNIDGANCREEAEKIAKWINNIITEKQNDFIYYSDNSDSESD